MYDLSKKKEKTRSQEFLKSACRHSVKARNTPFFMPWQLRDRLGVTCLTIRWPMQLIKEIFIKSIFLFSDIFWQKFLANLDGVISQNN